MKGITEGYEIFKASAKFVFKHPILLIPMILAGGVISYFVYWFSINYDLSVMTNEEFLLWLFIYTAVVTFSVSIASLILLEYIEQIETTGHPNIFLATFDALTRDLIRALPIILVWTVIKFGILLLEIIVAAAKAKERERRKERGRVFRSYRERRLDRSSSALDLLKTGVRMGVMIMMAAIAWEPIGPFKAASKGVDVYKYHISHMGTGVVLSRFLKLFILIPIILVALVLQATETIPYELIIGMGVYIGIAWSFGLLIEQVYTAELYLWYKTYESERSRTYGMDDDLRPSSMYDVGKPSLFDDIRDLG